MNKPASSKLFKLKAWLTLPEAAKHLTGVCGEEVTEADILRLSLDGHLKLSVFFVNHAYVKPGKTIFFDEIKLADSINKGVYPKEFRWAASIGDQNKMIMLCLRIDVGKFLEIGDKIVQIDGVWDLPMIGNEHIDIEFKYHRLTDGPSVDLVNIDGTFVEGPNGIICQLQEISDDRYGYHAAVMTQIDKLNRLKSSKNNNRRKEKLLVLRREKLEKLKEIKREWDNYGRYYPVWNLPKDSILVVRTDALREFEQLISDNEQERNTTTCSTPNKSELSETERNTMLKLIIGMAMDAYRYDPQIRRNDLTGNNKNSLSAKLALMGITITDDTVRKYLNEAKNIL